MHPSSALKKEETEAVFSQAGLLTKIDGPTECKKCKAKFC